ncbi:MAG: ribosome biosis GTPase / thiamine phosphate phosphatase [Streptomyces sp.]|nr:ribosome biosis GTPase / thiamine phosphate phosphatase [Streptomyces sp.]
MFNHASGSAPQLPLAGYGWDEEWDAEFTSHADEGLVPGRVVRVDRGLCDVVTAAGTLRADTALVTPRDPMRIVCTGDWAAIDLTPAAGPAVRALLPRRTTFVRSTSSKRSEGQVLAANVDHAVIAVSLAAELDLGRLERFLSLAWGRGASHTAGVSVRGYRWRRWPAASRPHRIVSRRAGHSGCIATARNLLRVSGGSSTNQLIRRGVPRGCPPRPRRSVLCLAARAGSACEAPGAGGLGS